MARHGIGAVAGSGAVLAITAAFAIYAAGDVWTARGGGTRYRAVFSSSDGLAVGAAVTLGGVPVGSVTSIRLDTGAMVADVSFTVRPDIVLSPDAALAIGGASGFGGGGTLAITPGSTKGSMPPGTVITATTPATSLEAAVGDYIFGAGIGSAR